jgi:hypothetical protein
MRTPALSLGVIIGVITVGATGLATPPTLASQKPSAKQQSAGRNAIDRWNQMSPEERERELAKLPPERARLIRERIRRFNQLPPEEKRQLRERYQRFQQLPPDKQQIVRQRMREFRELPLDRRPAIRRELDQIRALPESERRARLNSEEFRSRFSPQEQQIIRDIAENFPAPASQPK